MDTIEIVRFQVKGKATNLRKMLNFHIHDKELKTTQIIQNQGGQWQANLRLVPINQTFQIKINKIL